METEFRGVENSVTPRSVGIRFGMITGVISVSYFLITTLAGIEIIDGFWKWITYVIIITILVIAHKNYKEVGDGYMAYGQGISIALWIGIISGIVSSIFRYVYLKFINPAVLITLRETVLEQMEEQGFSKEQTELITQFASTLLSPEAIFVYLFFGAILFTLFFGLIVTIFTQKKNPEPVF